MNAAGVECHPADFPHRIVETLRFADTDRNGHITSSVFAICCQSGRLALLSDPARGVTPPASQFVLARLVLDYRREMHWPGFVEIATRIEHIGRSSIILAQALFQNDRCAATAQSVAVLMDAASRRSLAIPPAAVDRLQPFLGTDQRANGRSVFTSPYLDGGTGAHALPRRAPDDL
jgi:acyl-CoA thioester hydrolase